MTYERNGELSAALRTLWLTIARGGWWNLDDVRAEADVDDRFSVNRRLWDLKERGYLVAREIPKARRAKQTGRGSVPRTEYAVGPDCLVPFGLTAGEVAQALTGRELA